MGNKHGKQRGSSKKQQQQQQQHPVAKADGGKKIPHFSVYNTGNTSSKKEKSADENVPSSSSGKFTAAATAAATSWSSDAKEASVVTPAKEAMTQKAGHEKVENIDTAGGRPFMVDQADPNAKAPPGGDREKLNEIGTDCRTSYGAATTIQLAAEEKATRAEKTQCAQSVVARMQQSQSGGAPNLPGQDALRNEKVAKNDGKDSGQGQTRGEKDDDNDTATDLAKTTLTPTPTHEARAKALPDLVRTNVESRGGGGDAVDVEAAAANGSDGGVSKIKASNKHTTEKEEFDPVFWEKQLAQKDQKIRETGVLVESLAEEVQALRFQIVQSEASNDEIRTVVEEYEGTLSELRSESNKKSVWFEIEREKLLHSGQETVSDLDAAERAFNDVKRKYDRTRDAISGFKASEDALKSTVQELAERLRQKEEKYEVLKSTSEQKLNDLNTRLAGLRATSEGEVARMTVLLRKAELKMASMETEVKQKTMENQELADICDELIAKVGDQ